MSDLVHLSYGVWRPAETVTDLTGRAAALLSGCAESTVIAGSTAARLYGLWLPDSCAEDRVEVIVHPELPTPSARCGSRRAAVRARRRIVSAAEVTTSFGLPITTEARTWFDLASVLELPDLIALGDSALRGTATLTEMATIIGRSCNCPGVVRARRALPFLDARSRSRPESLLRYGLVSRGLPTPQVNRPIYNDQGEWLAEPDLHYDDARLAIEYDGAAHAELRRKRADMTRGLDVLGGGWLSLSVGPTEVFRRMDQVVYVIGRLRAERLAAT